MRRLISQAPLPLFAVGLALALTGCRGNKTQSPPIHLQQNMDFQKRFEAQEENPFFKDRRAMRPQPPHTIALGELKDSAYFYEGLPGGKPTR